MDNTIQVINHFILTVSIWDEEELSPVYHNLSVFTDKSQAELTCEQLNAMYSDNPDINFEVESVSHIRGVKYLAKYVDILAKI